LGDSGDIQAESLAILLQNNVDFTEIPDSVLSCLPPYVLNWLTRPDRATINPFPPEEYARRMDFTKTCVFTIDPETARDLDDAVHVKTLEDGSLEIGVHIADVSYYIPEGSVLDQVAMHRATSVYLVQQVIPMLPRLLCEQLCSLNPGEPKLTFSCVWRMKPDGTILSHWIGRSMIQSVCKLSYEHAQTMIESDGVSSLGTLPQIHGFSLDEVWSSVRQLNKIAVGMRQKRFGPGGALALNQSKIGFRLDAETMLPKSFHVQQRKDSNFMIEEFMLLANITVANHLYSHCGPLAFLRRHPEPNKNQLTFIAKTVESLGIKVDITSAKSLNDLLTQVHVKDPWTHAVLTFLFTKPMQLAKYFVAGALDCSADQFKHYALNVPMYTHFTSPIRRYPDVIVHRLLADSLACGPQTSASVDFLAK
jgi:DIS3-like exonuclease 2